MNIILNLIINGFAVFVTSYLLTGVQVDSYVTAIIVSIVLSIVNILIKPILILFTLPITIMTLGLFTLVINGLMILLVSYFVKGFYVENFLWAVIFSLVLSIVNWIIHMMTR